MKFIESFAGASRPHFVASLILALLLGAAESAVAVKSAHSQVDALSQASEIAEQLSENAPTISAGAFDKSLSELGALNALRLPQQHDHVGF